MQIKNQKMSTTRAILLVIAAILGLSAGARADAPLELILRVAEAQDLANDTLEEAMPALGSILTQIGPSSSFAAGESGFGHWSLSLGASGGLFEITDPNPGLISGSADPAPIEAGIAALYADASIGLFSGYRMGRTRSFLSLDLLMRLGFTISDHSNLDDIDFNALGPKDFKSFPGVGVRVGLLKGRGLPSVSLAAGMNFLTQRSFSVTDSTFQTQQNVLTLVERYFVELTLEQKVTFFLLEIGKDLGAFCPYAVIGVDRLKLDAKHQLLVVVDIDDPPEKSQRVQDEVEFTATKGVFFGGLELQMKAFRMAFEAGVLGGNTFGSVHLRITR